MSKQLVFASANENKVVEVAQKLGGSMSLLSLNTIGCLVDIPETGATLEENAIQKARYVWHNFQLDCFADDTGLEIEALNNEPGVYSARYAGPQKSSNDNINKVLANLKSIANRNARFRTVICLIVEGQEYLFEGVVEGQIAHTPIGDSGFGYDSIFVPSGGSKSFAQMTLEEKNTISHRALAISKLANYLQSVG